MSALRQLIEMLGRASTMDEVEALAGRLAVLSGICEEWAPLLAESFFRARAQLELGYWSALSDWTT